MVAGVIGLILFLAVGVTIFMMIGVLVMMDTVAVPREKLQEQPVVLQAIETGEMPVVDQKAA